MDFVGKIHNIAAMGGRPSLIDTPEERVLTIAHLYEASIEVENSAEIWDESHRKRAHDFVMGMIATLENNIDGRFQPNFTPSLKFPMCASKRGVDCYVPLIELEPCEFAVFPIVSGAMFADYLEYVSVSDERWLEMIEPLTKTPPSNAKEERARFEKVVKYFDRKIGPESDWGGWLGNYLPMRNEQDCTDEAASLYTFLNMLSVEGVLKHHYFDLNKWHADIPMFHYTALIREFGGKYFTVDTWSGPVVIWEEESWKIMYNEQKKIMFEPKI